MPELLSETVLHFKLHIDTTHFVMSQCSYLSCPIIHQRKALVNIYNIRPTTNNLNFLYNIRRNRNASAFMEKNLCMFLSLASCFWIEKKRIEKERKVDSS